MGHLKVRDSDIRVLLSEECNVKDQVYMKKKKRIIYLLEEILIFKEDMMNLYFSDKITDLDSVLYIRVPKLRRKEEEK